MKEVKRPCLSPGECLVGSSSDENAARRKACKHLSFHNFCKLSDFLQLILKDIWLIILPLMETLLKITKIYCIFWDFRGKLISNG